MWGLVSCLCGPGKPAAAGGRGAQATHRGPIGGRARPAAHHDRAGGTRQPAAPAPPHTHSVVCAKAETARLHAMIGRGVPPASALTHARILLKANQGEAGPGWTDAAIGAALEVNPATVARVRMRYVAAGLDAAIYRKPPARQYRRRLDGEQEAHLVALTCSAPPEGHRRWTLRLLADRLVELQVVEAGSYETSRQNLQPH